MRSCACVRGEYGAGKRWHRGLNLGPWHRVMSPTLAFIYLPRDRVLSSCSTAQAELALSTLLPQPLGCSEESYVPPHRALIFT